MYIYMYICLIFCVYKEIYVCICSEECAEPWAPPRMRRANVKAKRNQGCAEPRFRAAENECS